MKDLNPYDPEEMQKNSENIHSLKDFDPAKSTLIKTMNYEEKLKAEFEEVYNSLHSPKDCPCGNVGWYVRENRVSREPEQIQCEFCYCESNSKFNCGQRLNEIFNWFIQKLKSAVEEAEGKPLKYPIEDQLRLMLKDYREICSQIKPVDNITENELSIENQLDMQEDIIISFIRHQVEKAEKAGKTAGQIWENEYWLEHIALHAAVPVHLRRINKHQFIDRISQLKEGKQP
jgi:hypothetical protein